MIAASGWFAARPSGTDGLYIYAESLRSEDRLRAILRGASIVTSAIVFRGLKSDNGDALSQHKAILPAG